MLTGTQGAALGVQRVKRAGLSKVLGRLAKPNSRSTERTIRKAYHFRLPERGVANMGLSFACFCNCVPATAAVQTAVDSDETRDWLDSEQTGNHGYGD
jgi:hypothetical protein